MKVCENGAIDERWLERELQAGTSGSETSEEAEAIGSSSESVVSKLSILEKLRSPRPSDLEGCNSCSSQCCTCFIIEQKMRKIGTAY